ncbi:NAD(P)/FAD-dependent oxidoreductase [Paenirhodobacter sp.]|uniref:NAD(P)/FAD-dependent oxidoreductase n=1 Tax=Paenirhodobacter sp. TaxID=1965326 RepID=UPI003B3F3A64
MGTPSGHVVVIGAGIVGCCTAAELLDRGYRVTLVDPADPGGPQAASYGNGAFLSPASVIPMSFPGMWRKVPGYLTDRDGPLTIRWAHLPRLLPWLARFVLSGATEARLRRTAGVLNGLLADAPARHAALAARAGLGGLIHRDGLLYAFADRRAAEAEWLSWQVRRDLGVALRDLSAAEIQALIPGLSPHYTYGILVTGGGHCSDPGGYVAGLAEWCRQRGATVVRARATGFDTGPGLAVRTDAGPLPCDAAVIAAGIRSKALARQAGDRVPLESERGYHVELPHPGTGPAIPVMPQDGKMANTMVRGGLRASGQVELASADAPPDWNRAEILFRHLLRSYPGLSPAAERRHWQGNRPSTPDGLPVIGPARGIPGVFHAFGHGHVGLASGPKTAALVADLIGGSAPVLDPAPFTATRFHWTR